MQLFKNGYVVANLNADEKAYDAWPLAELKNDEAAELLTEKTYLEWFFKYDIKYYMQHIIPDLEYSLMYASHCEISNIPVKVLLFESPDDTVTVDDDVKIAEIMGYDCIGDVYNSYLQSESGVFEKALNKYGLADSLDDVLSFIKTRKEEIAAGANIEDFWEETPVRISIVDL